MHIYINIFKLIYLILLCPITNSESNLILFIGKYSMKISLECILLLYTIFCITDFCYRLNNIYISFIKYARVSYYNEITFFSHRGIDLM